MVPPAIYIKFRDGQVAHRPFYAAIGVDLAGRRDVLDLWASSTGHGESARYWLNVVELKNRGVQDIFFIICDGLKGRERGVPLRDRSDLHHPPDPRHAPVLLTQVLGPPRPRPAPGLKSNERQLHRSPGSPG